jgi:hypothetical protein
VIFFHFKTSLCVSDNSNNTSRYSILPGSGMINSSIGQSGWTVHMEKLNVAGYVTAKDPTIIVSLSFMRTTG